MKKQSAIREEDLNDMIDFGAKIIFNAEEGTYTDEGILIIIIHFFIKRYR